MKRSIFFVTILFAATFLISGCNIVPKSVQYQKEEEKLIGSTDIISPVVEEIQVVLKREGYEPGNTDGRMGQDTREAIKQFQESVGLKSTGYINERTLTQIEDIRRAKEERDLEKSYNVNVKSAYEYKPIAKEIQTALKNAGFDPGVIDGKIGPKTRQAVKEFQRTKGLTADGIVGPKTWAELQKYLSKK